MVCTVCNDGTCLTPDTCESLRTGRRWHDGRLAVLDLETTAAEPEDARIVSAAVGLVGGGEPTDLITLLANPGIPIPDEAAAIHGITTERAKRDGRPVDEVLDMVLGMLDRRPDGSPVVAMNARYDLTVLDRECRRHGADPVDAHRELLVVDPMILDRRLDKFRAGSRKLNALCAHYGARLEAAHTAGADAIAAGRLAWRIGKSGRVIRNIRYGSDVLERDALQAEWDRAKDHLVVLHGVQAKWAYEDAVELEAYFHKGNPRKGVPPQPDRVVPREWPVIPLRANVVEQPGEAWPIVEHEPERLPVVPADLRTEAAA